MSDHHSFKVVDTDIRRGYSEDELTTANVRREIENAKLALIDFEAREGTDARADALAAAFNALVHLDRWLPRLPDAFVCGYHWGHGFGRGSSWSSFSAHATREEAEAWLPYWEQQISGRSEWCIEQRPASITDFVRGGPPA